MGKYNHKKEFFSRKLQENQDLHDDNNWIMILDSDDLRDSGVYDELADTYNSYIADIFLDWVNTSKYMKSNYKIWIPQGRPDLSLISDGTSDRSASLFIDDKITFKGGLGGISLSARYIKSNLVKIKSDLEHNDVLFCGKRYLLGHVNPDSDVEFFQDPDGNVTVTDNDF